ncbi:MAG: glycosyltransferase family 9 protein [Candidatus Hydrogenedentes bacterium]|nr:glycosyltransferase family 9 protein [Candidatus Hydrogenedentota bacterium]
MSVERILVVQTTRMGDVIQTSPLVHRVRLKYPHAHIAYMVRRMGKLVAERHPDVDEVLVYDEDEMFLHLRADDSERLLTAYEFALARIEKLKSGRYDLIVNVTHSVASAMMLRIVNPPELAGAHLSSDWHFVLRGVWTTYFFTSVFSRDYNDLNLCDITRNFISGPPECRELFFKVNPEDDVYVDELFHEHQVNPGDFVVCMQLGASEENKRWSPQQFAGLATAMRQQFNARIFLIGITEEAPLGEVFEQYAPGLATHLYGKTSLPQIAALLRRSNLLVTNDTGTMHVAASVNCPITLVSVGHVHYRETGPYGEGHCAIEMRRRTLGRSDFVPGGLEERDQIAPQQVLRAVEYTLAYRKNRRLEQWEAGAELANVDIYISRFAPDGFLQFYPILQRPIAERDLLRMGYRAMWLEHLEGRHDAATEHEAVRLMLAQYGDPGADVRAAWFQDHDRIFGELVSIAQRGVAATSRLLDLLKRGRIAEAKDHVHQLMLLDEEGRIYSEINPPGRPLMLIARFERDNLEGTDPVKLAGATLQIYRACESRARLVKDKLALIHRIATTVYGARAAQ